MKYQCRLSPLRVFLPMAVALSATWAGAASTESSSCELRVFADRRAPFIIPKYITGKFAEHLGNNIYNGMDAQILRNPTFADYPFGTGQTSPDGVTTFQFEPDQIRRAIRQRAPRQGWPEKELESLAQAYQDGLACWWTRLGAREAVQVSPDAGLHGGRAQRVEVQVAGQGIAQWTYLPLQRVRRFEFEMVVRSPNLTNLALAVLPLEATSKLCASNLVTGVSADWTKRTGTLELCADLPPDTPYGLALTALAPGQFVIDRLLLRPIDHIDGADPDVVRLLKESRLPILRWPGGNFVSGYHWEDGVGPAEQRPTVPNYAWGGVEPNLFGTAEFVAFCRAAGCEPMICINAGSGTPGEAARWVEYCNGSLATPMGQLRAAHGHPEPYGIRHWEVGNELWGRWQFYWTTAQGYVDRYLQFAKAMLAADPAIQLYACGAPVFWGKNWNDTLMAGAASQLRTITDHPLIGGSVPGSTDPLDVFRDFMAVPAVLEQKWAELRKDMTKAGINEPRLAVTELQMFAHLGERASPDASGPGATARLTHETLVNPGTLAEALYDVLIYHAAVRLAPFVTLVTHSATVNHGGGLRKERERVYANPCHFAQAAFAAFAQATPVFAELAALREPAPLVLPELRNATKACSYPVLDALAALAPDGALLLSVVHCGTAGPARLDVQLNQFKAGDRAEARTLTGPVPWAVNTLENPEAIKPADSSVPVHNLSLTLHVPPCSVLRVRIPPAP
jgi:alpha-N-arabinofuranosidase